MLTEREKDDLIRLTREFDENHRTGRSNKTIKEMDLAKDLFPILSSLFKNDGYILETKIHDRNSQVDYLATKQGEIDSIGIEFKANLRRADLGIQQLIHAAKLHQFQSAILISLRGFSQSGFLQARTEEPLKIQLLDIEGIKNWVSRLEVEKDFDVLSIEDIIKFTSKAFAQKIADDPGSLMKLEWRDLERIIAELFEGLSFNVTLTPPAKDGGKDIILECTNKGTHESYIVEIKHWRSLQKVGSPAVKQFLSVICKEKRKSGLFLSTYGFAENAFEGLTEIQRKTVYFGGQKKIVSLCKSYLKVKSGIWSPMENMEDLISGI